MINKSFFIHLYKKHHYSETCTCDGHYFDTEKAEIFPLFPYVWIMQVIFKGVVLCLVIVGKDKNKNYYVVRIAGCACSRYTLKLSLIFS